MESSQRKNNQGVSVAGPKKIAKQFVRWFKASPLLVALSLQLIISLCITIPRLSLPDIFPLLILAGVIASGSDGSETPNSESLIPTHLRELHFNLLKPKGKEAIEKDWPGRANYAYNDPKLVAHISNGGNYGVLAKADVLIIETDTRELAELVKTNLPATFTDRSPGHGCPHFYFKLAGSNGNLRTIPLFIQRNGAKENIGHLKYGNSYVVGPHCTHPNGGTYEIIQDRPLAQVTADQVLELLAPYIARKAHEAERVLAKEHHTALEFDVTKIVDLDQFHRQGSEYYGAHPVHGSETGHNFWLNPQKNTWFCFRCMSGGARFSSSLSLNM